MEKSLYIWTLSLGITKPSEFIERKKVFIIRQDL